VTFIEITLRFTQPVLLQSWGGEFDKNTGEENPKTRGVPLKALRLGNEPAVDGARRTYYRSEVGKLLHLRRWSRSEMANALRDLTRYKTNTSEMRIEVVHRAVRYATATPSHHQARGMETHSTRLNYVDTQMQAINHTMMQQ
jgi:hypothetical protein